MTCWRTAVPCAAGLLALLAAVAPAAGGARGVSSQGEEPPPAAPAYEETDVQAGGAVEGAVRLADRPPIPSAHKVTKDEATCGERIPNETILIAPDGSLRNVVVSLEGISKGKPVNRDALIRLDNVECRFVPHVIAMSVSQKLEIVNSDPILHDAHAFLDGVKTVFDVALPVQNQKVPKRFPSSGLYVIKCDAGHIWSTAYVQAFDHPYFAVTDGMGAFKIDGVPPGRYRLRAWHESLGARSLEVEVGAGRSTEVVIDRLSR